MLADSNGRKEGKNRIVRREDQDVGFMYSLAPEHEQPFRKEKVPDTFVPLQDNRTARERFLDSQNTGGGRVMPTDPMFGEHPRKNSGTGAYRERPQCMPDVDARTRLISQLQSDVFFNGYQEVAVPVAAQNLEKLCPTDITWFSQRGTQGRLYQDDEEKNKEYNRRCEAEFEQHVFEDADPKQNYRRSEMLMQQRRDRINEKREEENRRKQNPHYSDIFGRPTYELPKPLASRGKLCSQETGLKWSDSKSELVRRENDRSGNVDVSASARKLSDVYCSTLKSGFGGLTPMDGEEVKESARRYRGQSPKRLDTGDSSKLQNIRGGGARQIHQAHMQTSAVLNADRPVPQRWDVSPVILELHLFGLRPEVEEKDIKDKCIDADVGHVIRVHIEMDPVGGFCKGRARVTIRHIPGQYSPLEKAVERLEVATDWTVTVLET